MSPSWRERLFVTLAPDRLTLARYARGWNPRVKNKETLACTSTAPSAPPWRAAVEVLSTHLSKREIASADTTIILSDAFVQYLLIPWNANVATKTEQLGFAQKLFERSYGEEASRWIVKLSNGPAGASQVAAATERALLETLMGMFDAPRMRLRALVPQLMPIFNANRRAFGRNAWVVVMGFDRMFLGFLRDGTWQCLRSRPLPHPGTSIDEILEQESLLQGITLGESKFYLYRADGSPATSLAHASSNSTLEFTAEASS